MTAKSPGKSEMDLPQTLAGLIRTSLEHQPRPFLAAICGWADTGKSALTAQLRAALTAHGVEADSISTDDFMRDRAERNALGVNGYDFRSLDVHALRGAIARFVNREPFGVHPYDNRTGTRNPQPKTVLPVQVLIVEGIHSLHVSIAEQIALKVFIDSDEATLRHLRYRGNVQKRGMTPDDAAARISSEWKDYNVFVRPGIEIADLVVQVDKDFVYTRAK
jgi:uridine kinase